MVQWPAVRKPGLPSAVVTLKPSEQRPPSPQMASPPAILVVNLPSVRFSSALPPWALSCFLSLASSAPLTVLSAVTTTLLDFTSTARAVPVTSFSVSAFLAEVSWESVCSTTRALAPAASTFSLAASSVTLTTSCLASAS